MKGNENPYLPKKKQKHVKSPGTVSNGCKIASSEHGLSLYWGGWTDVRWLSREQIRHLNSMTQWWAHVRWPPGAVQTYSKTAA